MAVISTKELFDAYFNSRPKSYQVKMRSEVDRSEIYEYEKKNRKAIRRYER